MSGTAIFYVHVDAEGCEAELKLNDAPIVPLSRAYPLIAFPTVSEWVIAGDNQLSLEVFAAEADARVHAALGWAYPGETPGRDDPNERIVLDWSPPSEAGGVTPGYPQRVVELGVADHDFGRWSWQFSPEFDIDPRTTADLVDFVRMLHAAVEGGSFDVLLDACTIKFNEVAPCYDMAVAEARERLRSGLSYLAGLPGFRLAAFDERDLELRLHCEGRLVEPTTRGGEAILRQARPIGGESWELPLFIARTNWEITAGELTIVR